jgi:formiminoglutamase
LDQWWSTATQHMDARLESWCADLIQKDFGLELDMDVLADMGSSAQSPVGLGLMEVMSLIKKLKGNQNLRYVHLCEGAPELGLYPAQVVKALGAIVLAVVD